MIITYSHKMCNSILQPKHLQQWTISSQRHSIKMEKLTDKTLNTKSCHKQTTHVIFSVRNNNNTNQIL